MRFLLSQLIACFVLAVAACQPASTVDYSMSVLKRSNQCAITQPQMRLLMSSEEISALERRLPTSRAGSNSDSGAEHQHQFETADVILIAMGTKPSAGYRINVESDNVSVQGATMRLPISFAEPNGQMSASVITSSCIVLAVEKTNVSRFVAGDTGLLIDR